MALTRKRQAWLEEYLKCWNATEAARRVGFAHPNAQGPRLLLDVRMQEAIQVRLDELAMSANEVLLRLAEHARGTMEDFTEIIELDDKGRSTFIVSLSKAKRLGKLGLIKKLTYTKDGGYTIELYDSQAALSLIGKHHGLFKDITEHTGAGGGPIRMQEVTPDFSKLSDDELDNYIRLCEKLRGGSAGTGKAEAD